MNAVEIDDAVSDLAAKPFNRAEFPFTFLAAFGNKETTVRRLRSGSASDVPGGVLQRNNIHLATCDEGAVEATLQALRASPKTAANRVKFVLATDGAELQAHDLTSDEPLACAFADLGRNFGFLLPLAGISAVRAIKENPIDVKATGRLNKLYLQLLADNPAWQTDAKRPELNRFMARLIFCFFAEDTGIFLPQLFSRTIDQFSRGPDGDPQAVISELFRAMATPIHERANANLRTWADSFPFVNGGLFPEVGEVPRISRMARTYLLRAGELQWQEINPDIFGSMIQAVADEDERGSLGMHYTSVPNILKVLNPLFLDDLRAELEVAGDSVRKLNALRRRIAAIRVFDPACGSGNFLVIAYIHMREIERQVIERLGDDPKSLIPLTNFFGIEIKSFAAEIARLALLIAEFQCDARMISQRAACLNVLPLHRTGQVDIGNALRMDWLKVCPPALPAMEEWDLGGPTGRLALQENSLNGGCAADTYICGNPPFSGARKQSSDQKDDLSLAFSGSNIAWKNADYVGGWFWKAARYCKSGQGNFCFVATNSFCQGQQVSIVWPLILNAGLRIRFAYEPFHWRNLAASNAGVTVIVVGLDSDAAGSRIIFADDSQRQVDNINPYLTPHQVEAIPPSRKPIWLEHSLEYGVYYSKSEGLLLSLQEKNSLIADGLPAEYTRRFLGSTQFINGIERYCLWIDDNEVEKAQKIPEVRRRLNEVRRDRLATSDQAVRKLAGRPFQFRERKGDGVAKLFVPIVSSENRQYFPAGIVSEDTVPSNKAFFASGASLWMLSIVISRIHMMWIATVCGRLRMDYSYSNVLGWNTFPAPAMTMQDKKSLARCAGDILLAREAHFPSTVADLYDPEAMPEDLRRAHERNDETLERIYIGRKFRNDTERLEHLFKRYTDLTASDAAPRHKGASKKRKEAA